MRKYVLLTCILVLILIMLAVFIPTLINQNGSEKAGQSFHTAFPAAEVRDLSITLSGTSLNVRPGETDALLLDTTDLEVETEFNGSRLTVSEKKTFRRSATMDIVLPEGFALNDFSAALGAGNLTATDFSCGSITISCNVGNVWLLLGNTPDKMDLNVGVGDASVTFPGEQQIRIQAPYGLGNRDYAERFIVTDDAQYKIDVSVGNTTLR